MSVKELRFATNARDEMVRGVDTLVNAVKVTLGPKGRNVMLEVAGGLPRITKDGAAVAQEIEAADRFKNVGIQLVKEVAARTHDLAGDGTTTATVLAGAIFRAGCKSVAAGMNPLDLKRGIDKAVEAVVSDLARMAKQVRTNAEISQVATVSANGEKAIGKMIAEAMEKVGRTGVITVEDGTALETELEVVDGMQFDRGFLSAYFVTDTDRMTADFANPYILIHDQTLSNMAPLLPLLEAVNKSARPLLIIAGDVEGDALATLVVNKLRGSLKVAAVKAPGYGDRRKDWLGDIATLTGGIVVTSDTGMTLESVTLAALGQARRVIVDGDSTTIVHGKGEKAAIAARREQLRRQIEQADAGDDADRLKARLGQLGGGVAVIHVGGISEVAMRDRKSRIDDALNATRAAVAEGIVAGGGVALMRASRRLSQLNAPNRDQQAGIDIIRRALIAPLRQIADNAGDDGAVVCGRVAESHQENFGYDAQTARYVDMLKVGIVDPTKVVRIALQDAASIAGLLITTEAVVVDGR